MSKNPLFQVRTSEKIGCVGLGLLLALFGFGLIADKCSNQGLFSPTGMNEKNPVVEPMSLRVPQSTSQLMSVGR